MANYLLMIDSFKDCLTSTEAEEAAKRAIIQCDNKAKVRCIPATDGGEGMIDAFLAITTGQRMNVMVHNPIKQCIKAQYAITKNGVALIETAQAVGLHLVPKALRNPLTATSYGVGEIVVDARKKGCKQFIVGLGGTCTCDGGMGMWQAINDLTENKKDVKDYFSDCYFLLASDVTNPLCGSKGAARIFAPQKGATPGMVIKIEEKLQQVAKHNEQLYGYDCSTMAGAGAAGGLGYAFMQYLKAKCTSGVNLLLNYMNFDSLVKDYDVVITGEGSADAQTLMGKLPFGIMQRAKAQSVPTWLIAGKIQNRDVLLKAGFERMICINPPHSPLQEAMQKEVALRRIRENLRCEINKMK